MTKRRLWTEQEVAVLRRLYPDFSCEKIGQKMGRTTSSVLNKATDMRLQKSAAFLASEASGRIQRGKPMQATADSRFKKGQTPWNKGMPGSTGLHENSRRTQFKPHAAHEHRNYKPIGSLRISKDGYLERKVTDARSLAPSRRWTAVHRLVFEEAHGPIPAKHVVVFKPGQKTTEPDLITADRLECIPRKELARRNGPLGKHPEMAKLYQLKGAISRQVNRIKQQHQDATA